jgi:hypothetical protein
MKSTHSDRLQRWLGDEKVNEISRAMKGWYGPPIHILDVPGSVRVCGDGDFIGDFDRGFYATAADAFREVWMRMGRVQHGQMNVGFASIGDALLRSSSGYGQTIPIAKAGATGVQFASSTLWRVGNTPSAGSAGAAAAGGTAHVSSNAGALAQTNPASGTLHLVGADMLASQANNSLLVYDRLFSVAKTASSSATEAVSGVPTRYQSTTATDAEYIGGNFGFIEAFTALGAFAHNWTTCLYTDQANASSTLPSVTGNNACIIDRLDQPINTWFVPLAAGDVGIKAWTQMQCSVATVTGTAQFCIGHPLGFMAFPVVSTTLPFDWLTNRNQAPRVIDNACIALLEVIKPSTTATTYSGLMHFTSAA